MFDEYHILYDKFGGKKRYRPVFFRPAIYYFYTMNEPRGHIFQHFKILIKHALISVKLLRIIQKNKGSKSHDCGMVCTVTVCSETKDMGLDISPLKRLLHAMLEMY